MSKEPEKIGKAFDLCYFKVPVEITTNEEGDLIASFREVDHKDCCFKIEEVVFETAHDAQLESVRLNNKNTQTLRIATKLNKTGDMITRIILCEQGKVKINTNI